MTELLINTLKDLNFPIIRQGSISEDESYPDTFFTYWNNDTPGDAFYDNKENKFIWNFDLNAYSTDPLIVYQMLKDAKIKLKEKGFIVTGQGYDVASDESSHIGRGINVIKEEI